MQTAERLVALARLFQAELAERYGSEPSTDVPHFSVVETSDASAPKGLVEPPMACVVAAVEEAPR